MHGGTHTFTSWFHGPLARYVKLRVTHAPGMPGTLSPTTRVSDPDMHYGTCVTHVPRCMPGSLTTGFLWCRWRGKRSRHSRRMRNQQFCASGKRTIQTHAVYCGRVWKQTIPVGGSQIKTVNDLTKMKFNVSKISFECVSNFRHVNTETNEMVCLQRCVNYGIFAICS